MKSLPDSSWIEQGALFLTRSNALIQRRLGGSLSPPVSVRPCLLPLPPPPGPWEFPPDPQDRVTFLEFPTRCQHPLNLAKCLGQPPSEQFRRLADLGLSIPDVV